MTGASDAPDAENRATTRDRSAGPASLLSAAISVARTRPRAIVVLVVAAGVIAGLDWMVLHDPVPAVAAHDRPPGNITLMFDGLVGVVSGASVPVGALVGLKAEWLAWTLGALLAEWLVVAGSGLYALSRLLEVPITRDAALRYGAVSAFVQADTLFWLGAGGFFHIEMGPILGIPLVIGFVVVAARLFALPGFLVLGRSLTGAVRESWRLTRGHGWTVGSIVVLLGVANHLFVSTLPVGALGTGVVATLHAGAVAVFLARQLPDVDRGARGA